MTGNTLQPIPDVKPSARTNRPHRLRFALAILFLTATPALSPDLPGVQLRAAKKDARDKDEVPATVLAGMAENDRRLSGVRCDLVYTFLQSAEDSASTEAFRAEYSHGYILQCWTSRTVLQGSSLPAPIDK